MLFSMSDNISEHDEDSDTEVDQHITTDVEHKFGQDAVTDYLISTYKTAENEIQEGKNLFIM